MRPSQRVRIWSRLDAGSSMLNRFLDFLTSISPSAWLRAGFLALIQSLQFVILLSFFLLFTPSVSHMDFIPSLYPVVHPNRDSRIYWWGVLFFNAMLLLIAVMAFKNTQKKKSFVPIYGAILVEAIVLMVLFTGLHLKLVGDQVVPMPNALFIIGSLSAVFAKALLPGVWRSVSSAHGHSKITPVKAQGAVFTQKWFCLLVFISLFCASVFFIPDMHALFDAVYFLERQGQNLIYVFGAAYWSFSGGLPGVDGINLYGVGLPVVIGQICKLAGAFNWEMIFQVILWLIIAYTVIWFAVCTRIFRAPLLALAVWLIYVKFRLLSYDGGGLGIFLRLNASPIRYYGDVLFLAAICAHWSSRKRAWLIAAGCIAAFHLFLNTSIGGILCLLMGVYSFIYVLADMKTTPTEKYKSLKDVLLALGVSAALYWSIMLGLYWSNLAQPLFWHEFFFYLKAPMEGFSSGLYLNNLFTEPGTFLFSLGLITLYLLGLWPALCLLLQRRFADMRPMIILVWSFYGLLHHQHFFSALDSITRDLTIGLLLVFIWYDILIEQQPHFLKQRVSVVLLISALILFFNSPNWKDYPDIFHPKVRLIETVDNSYLKEYFDKTYAFDEDVKLIQKLTASGDHVPIVSDHELILLIKSHRKPFFYVFPLIFSDQLGRMWWPADQFMSMSQFQRTMDQIKNEKPPVIFVERKMFQIPVPAPTRGFAYPLSQIVNEVLKEYKPVESSPLLIAFRRKD